MRFRSSALPFAVLLAGSVPTLAQGPASPPPSWQTPGVSIARTIVKGTVEEGAATTSIEQVFANATDRPQEGQWLLPVPPGAVADGLKLIVGGVEMQAEVLDANLARNVYESIVRQRRDPALLEYVGDGLLRARVFPIPPRGEVSVVVRLRQLLPLQQGLGEWTLPLRALRLSEQHQGPIALDLTVRSTKALKTVVTSRPDAEVIWKGETEARVAFEIAPGAPVERDLQVLFGLAESEFGLFALHHRKEGQDGWFTLFVSPRRSLPEASLPPRCVQFVIDTSGSMRGEKMEQAKAALRAFAKSLRPVDRFQIVPFSTEARPFFAEPMPASEKALAEASARIDELAAAGGTNIADALKVALAGAEPCSAEEMSIVVFVTDGMPTVGTTSAKAILEDAKAACGPHVRLFTFGVGQDVNRPLLADLAIDLRGASDFVASGEPLDRKTSALCLRIREPALTDVTVQCAGLERFDLTPRAVPDLFAGDTLQLTGRYRGTGTQAVVLRGRLGGQTREYRYEVAFPTVETRHDFVPVAWANRQIGLLVEQIRRTGATNELVDEVKRLGTEFGLTTPYTAALAVEEGMRLPTAGGGRGLHLGGPATPGPAGPAAPAEPRLRDGVATVTGSDEFYLGATRRLEAGAEQKSKDTAARRAAGRTFYRRGTSWVEHGLPEDWEAKGERIAAFSEAYFALLKQNPELREVFALGTDVALRIGERIVRVVPEAKPADPAPRGDAKPVSAG